MEVAKKKKIVPLDAEHMHQVIMDSPGQLKEGLALAANAKLPGHFSRVLVCGMGGSALPGDVANTLLNISAPLRVHRDYDLPQGTTKDTLVVCISYSGNTEETVSAAQQAVDRGLPCITIASGGKLQTLAQQHQLPLVRIPSGIQPRSALNMLFSALAQVLINHQLTPDIASDIEMVAGELQKALPVLEKEGKQLAAKLTGKIPMIYSDPHMASIARIWKIKFNETGKNPAFCNEFPELNHNEMVGFSRLARGNPFRFIIIRDQETHPRTQKRMDLFAQMLKKRGSATDFIELKENSRMENALVALMIADWVSYYLAINNGVDPTPVAMVEEFKAQMKK